MQFLLLLLLNSFVIAESIEEYSFTSSKQQIRYQQLIKDIRCPVCQGQSIGGSNASLAKDLRTVVRKMLKNNKTDTQIFNFMTARYGDFAVFKPPINRYTYFLWFAPFIFIVLVIFMFMRKKNINSSINPNKAKLEQAKKLLED